jgi:hypothetical protein
MIGKDGEVGSAISVNDAESLRQFINTLDNTFGRKNLINAVDADVLASGGDLFSTARTAASQRFATLDNPATQRALNTLGELQQGKTAQNFIQQQIVGAPAQDVESLLKTLQSKPESIDAIRAGVMQHLEKKAVDVNSGKFSGATFNKELERLGPKIELLFGEKGAAQLKSLAQAALDVTYEPPYAAVNHSNSGVTVLSAMADRLKSAGRYGKATPIVGPMADKAREVAAENAAQRELREALVARANAPALSLDPRVKLWVDALSSASAPVSVAALNQAKKENQKRADSK